MNINTNDPYIIAKLFTESPDKPEKLSGGIINDSYLCGEIVLQRLGRMFDQLVVADMIAVINFLQIHDLPFALPTPIPLLNCKNQSGLTDYKNYIVIDQNGSVWRATKYIKNEEIKCEKATIIQNTAAALGILHNRLASFNYIPRFQIKNFHQTDKYIELLKSCKIKNIKAKLLQKNIVNLAPNYYLTNEEKQIIHGDTKITNFLFHEDGSIAAIIDWDTIMQSSPLVDLGDAISSWCRHGDKFNNLLFDQLVDSYNKSAEKKFSRSKIADTGMLIALELAARFLIDYANGGIYFHLSDDKSENIILCLEEAKNFYRYFENIYSAIHASPYSEVIDDMKRQNDVLHHDNVG